MPTSDCSTPNIDDVEGFEPKDEPQPPPFHQPGLTPSALSNVDADTNGGVLDVPLLYGVGG
jgi:hypothetical protein